MRARPRRVAVHRARRTPAGLVKSRQAGDTDLVEAIAGREVPERLVAGDELTVAARRKALAELPVEGSQLPDQFEKPSTTTTVAIASAGPGTHTADRRVPSADRSRSASAGGR